MDVRIKEINEGNRHRRTHVPAGKPTCDSIVTTASDSSISTHLSEANTDCNACVARATSRTVCANTSALAVCHSRTRTPATTSGVVHVNKPVFTPTADAALNKVTGAIAKTITAALLCCHAYNHWVRIKFNLSRLASRKSNELAISDPTTKRDQLDGHTNCLKNSVPVSRGAKQQ